MDAQRIDDCPKLPECRVRQDDVLPRIVGTLIKSVSKAMSSTTAAIPRPTSCQTEIASCWRTAIRRSGRSAIRPRGVAQVKWAQANPPEYSYSAFCKNVKAFGCAGYIVSFSGRRVLYFGRTAETHVEHFPQ